MDRLRIYLSPPCPMKEAIVSPRPKAATPATIPVPVASYRVCSPTTRPKAPAAKPKFPAPSPIDVASIALEGDFLGSGGVVFIVGSCFFSRDMWPTRARRCAVRGCAAGPSRLEIIEPMPLLTWREFH